MSANIVRAEYETLESIAQRFQSRADAMEQVRAAVARGVEALQQGGWEGEGAAAFFAESQDVILPAIQRLVTALEMAGTVTLEISAILQRADADAAKPFQQNGTASQTQEELGFLGHAGDFMQGMYDEVADSLIGLYNLIMHPLDTWEGLKYAWHNPMAVLEGMWEPYREAIESGHPAVAAGRGLIFALSLIGPGIILKGGKVLKAGDVAADAARAADVAADAARAADVAADAARAADVAADSARAADLAVDVERLSTSIHRVSATQRIVKVELMKMSYPNIVDAAADYQKAPIGSALRSDLTDLLALESRHYEKDPSRLVLGRWREGGGDYRHEALTNGGIWYETPTGVYDKFGSSDAIWPINERFLQHHLELGVPRIEFHDIPDAVRQEVLRIQKGGNPAGASGLAREILYLEKHAAEFGYVREGVNFVKRPPPP